MDNDQTTVRGQAHIILRRLLGSGDPSASCAWANTVPRLGDVHTQVCTSLCAALTEFGPWWVGFTTANRKANKDQQAQVAADPLGDGWLIEGGLYQEDRGSDQRLWLLRRITDGRCFFIHHDPEHPDRALMGIGSTMDVDAVIVRKDMHRVRDIPLPAGECPVCPRAGRLHMVREDNVKDGRCPGGCRFHYPMTSTRTCQFADVATPEGAALAAGYFGRASTEPPKNNDVPAEDLESIRDELRAADARLTGVGIRIPEVQSAIRRLFHFQLARPPYAAPTVTPIVVEAGSIWRLKEDALVPENFTASLPVEVMYVTGAEGCGFMPRVTIEEKSTGIGTLSATLFLDDFLVRYDQIYSARRTIPKDADPRRTSVAQDELRVDLPPLATPPEQDVPPSLANGISSVINRHSRENASNTPDFILANFMLGALRAFEGATKERDGWYGMDPAPGRLRDAVVAEMGPTANRNQTSPTPTDEARPIVVGATDAEIEARRTAREKILARIVTESDDPNLDAVRLVELCRGYETLSAVR